MQRSLELVENQTFWISHQSFSYEIHLYFFHDMMYIDCKKNGQLVVSGQRVMANQWILPTYMVQGGLNFRVETYQSDADDYIDYKDFNTKFRFNYYAESEIALMEE